MFTSGRFSTRQMDSNSGRVPLEFMSFYLDMSTEDQIAEDKTQHTDDALGEETGEFQQFSDIGNPVEQRIFSTPQQVAIPTPSPSTDGSSSGFVEKTFSFSRPRS